MFQLKGSSNGKSVKNQWPLTVTARIIKMTQDGSTAKDAFTTAIAEYNATNPTKPLIAPPSLEDYSSSILWGMKKRFAAKCNNPKAKGYREAIELATKYGLGSDEPSTVPAVDGGDGLGAETVTDEVEVDDAE